MNMRVRERGLWYVLVGCGLVSLGVLAGGTLSWAYQTPYKKPNPSLKLCIAVPPDGVLDCGDVWDPDECVASKIYAINEFPDGSVDSDTKSNTHQVQRNCWFEVYCDWDFSWTPHCQVNGWGPWHPAAKTESYLPPGEG